MTDISKIKLPNGSEYDLVSKKTRGIYRGQIESTSTATAFTVTIDGITEYYDGLTLSIRNPVITSAANCTLNVNNLGAKRIWASQQNTFVSTSILKGAQFLFTYDGINDRWIKQQGTQTTNSNTVGEYAGSCLAGPFGMARYCLFMKVDDQHWESLVKTSGTGTSKEKNLHGFLLRSPILYQNGNTYTQGNLAGQGSCWSTISFDTRYSTNAGSFSTAGKSFYLVGTVVDEEYFYLSDTWWANSLPNEEDGKVYIYIGQMYSAYQCTLAPKHPIYIYKNNELIQLIVPSDGSLIKNIPVNSTKKKQGSICSFFDPVGELPLKSLTVNIDPVQDLHGYDSPWPSGGGKNLANPDTVSKGGYYNGSGGWSANNKSATTDLIPVKSNTVYVSSIFDKNGVRLSGCVATLWDDENTCTGQITSASFTTTESTKFVRIRNFDAQESYVTSDDFVFQLEEGSTATAYAPYENICPISGWSEANVVACGKNLFGGDAWFGTGGTDDRENRTVSGSGASTLPYLARGLIGKYKPNTRYTLILTMTSTATNGRPGFQFMYTDGTYSVMSVSGLDTTKKTFAIVSAANKTLLRIDRTSYSGTKTYYVDECGLFEGVLTADDFEEYHGTPITIDFGQTVYGGVLDVLSGALTVDKVMVVYDGSSDESWYAGYNGYYITDTGIGTIIAATRNKVMCDRFPIVPDRSKPGLCPINQTLYFCRIDTLWPNISAFKAYIAENPIEVICPIATPIEITLDPHEFESLYGSNTIYADTGDTSIEYIANNGVIIPDASLTRPGLMTISDKEKINQIDDIYEEIDNTKNHIIFSKTQPVNQQDGDIWMVLSEKTISLSSAETEVF